MPLYYVIWQHFFPQEYESPRCALGILLCARPVRAPVQPAHAEPLPAGAQLHLPVLLHLHVPDEPRLGLWAHSLLIALVVLFHFDTRMAMLAYAGRHRAGLPGLCRARRPGLPAQPRVLQQLPIHWFTIAVLSVVKMGRHVLAQEKLAGMGAGLATVAHELRTPLTSVDANVRGLLRWLQRGPPRPADAAIDALARIQFEVRHMNHMIDLFLLSATAVNRKLEAVENVSMQDSVAAVLRRYPFSSTAQRDVVQVDVRADFTVRRPVRAGAVVLLNLLRNALQGIQRAGKGRVRIIIDGARPAPLLFIDTGCGIAASRLPLIFRRFYSIRRTTAAASAWRCARKSCRPGMRASAACRARAPTPSSCWNFPRQPFPSIHRAR
jgi:two-component system CAI-1 autoinducer sensor kinase/phosphatase CqsS